jgi:hypothetical protein
MEEVSNFSPASAVPMTVKMPEPMTAPMPSEVRESGPRVLRSLCSGSSDSAMSLSMDLQAKSWRGRRRLLLIQCKECTGGLGIQAMYWPSTQLLRAAAPDVAGLAVRAIDIAAPSIRDD